MTVGTTICDVVSVRPAGIEDFDRWVDRATQPIARTAVGQQVAEMRAYRTVAEVCAPPMAIQTDRNPAHTTTLSVDSVETALLPA